MRMSYGQHQSQIQTQKQITSPQMIQSMEILQMSVQQLNERIEQELLENPVLEMQQETPDEQADASQSDTAVETATDTPADEERELVIDNDSGAEDFERWGEMDSVMPDFHEERPRLSRAALEEAGQRKLDAMANITARPETLNDHLLDQLSWFDIEGRTRNVAELIISNLDDSGYLPVPVEDLSGSDEDAPQIAAEALRIVQDMDPAGVGARDLRECLLLQLRSDMPFYEHLKLLISDHLEDIEHNRLPQISRATGYSISLLQEIFQHLKRLNPKPGAEFQTSPVPLAVPDLFVDKDENGRYMVRLDEYETPPLRINNYYRNLAGRGETTGEAKTYINQRINSAQWLINAIIQRRTTLLRVSQAIVDRQTEFLEIGPQAILPLTMQEIADEVEVHVSTISRAVEDKWIQTPRGLFALRQFFSGGTVGSDGTQVARGRIQAKLQEIIDSEDKQSPLSDEAILQELAAQGIEVARRTIVKYRKQMNIPSSRMRRSWSE